MEKLLIWRTHQPTGFIWEALGAERFLFNPLSNQTHILNPLGAAVLELLTEHPRSKDDLLDQLLAETSDSDPKTLSLHLTQHLLQLEQLGLIEPHHEVRRA